MRPGDVPAELAEKMARARKSAQHGRPLTNAEWSAVRSRIEETWIASALAAVLPEIQAQALREAARDIRPTDGYANEWLGYRAARLTARDHCDGGCVDPG